MELDSCTTTFVTVINGCTVHSAPTVNGDTATVTRSSCHFVYCVIKVAWHRMIM